MSGHSATLSKEQFLEYQENGLLRVTLPSKPRDFLTNFLEEVALWLKHFGGIEISPNSLADELPKIAENNRQLIAKLYKVTRRFPSVKRLACDPWLAEISAKLIDTDLVSCCPFVSVRIDLPGEDKYLLEAHQDFPYIQDSLDGITWWIPFADVPTYVGPPAFIYGSHKLGLLQVREFDYLSTGQSGGKSFSISDKSFLLGDLNYVESTPIQFGEAVLFSALLVHKSQPNLSNRARITAQIRFGNPLSQDSFGRNYPEGLYLGDSFYKSYPEKVLRD